MRLLALPRRCGALLAIIAMLVALTGCGRNDPVSRGRITAFDTTIDLTLIGVDRQRAAEITRVLEADMQTMQRAWHAWQPGPVSRMNALFNESDAAFAAPPSVLPLLRLSKSLSLESGGLFNPAIGHLVRAWGFQGRSANCLRPPSEELIRKAIEAHPSMQDVTIDGFRVSSSNHMVKLDFRAIQLGFALDQAVARLQEMGVNNASISADGNLRVIGSRDGHPWSATLRSPEGGAVFTTLPVRDNEAVFTAASYKRNFTWEGKLYHDIIDPRTGYPAEGTASVTVLHPNATTAAAAANALFIAGASDWYRVAKMMGVRYVMLTDSNGTVYMNPAMRARVKLSGSNREVVVSDPLT
ncbi:MAG: FAD:protein FMN transferase [Chromatiaceae bacterium]|nr:FAD:protein FMN transferase [Gammaproteobacteria bacterium]MCP5313224.1 FAD:protein FMN transferase [Chromatiaceae bacterium]